MDFLKLREDDDIEKILTEAYLNIHGIKDEELYNPLLNIPEGLQDKPELYFAYLLSQPQFFWFTCKHIFNVNILPFQSVILRELWQRRFPMLEASRGAGKSFCLGLYVLLRLLFTKDRKIILCGSSFRQSKIVFGYAESIIGNSSILRGMFPSDSICKANDNYEIRYQNSYARALPIGCCAPETLVTTTKGIKRLVDLRRNETENLIWSNGEFRKQGFFFDSGVCESMKVRTSLGYEICVTSNHKIKILKNGNIEWCRADELNHGDKVLIDISRRWHKADTKISVDSMAQMGRERVELSEKELRSSKPKVLAYLRELIKSFDRGTTVEIPLTEEYGKLLQYVLTHFSVTSSLFLAKNCCSLTINRQDADFLLEMKETEKMKDRKEIYYDEISNITKSIHRNMYDINVPDGNEYGGNCMFSHNTGDKIRGQRANDIINDEFSCLDVNTLLQTDLGLIRIKDYMLTSPNSLLNMNNELESPDRIIRTPLVDTYKITTDYGFSFKCSDIHQVMAKDGWKKCIDLTDQDHIELDFNDYFPEKYYVQDDLVINEKWGWLIGLMVSEGTMTNRNYFSICNTDKTIIDKVLADFPELNFKLYHKEAYKDPRGWNCKESWTLHCSNTKLRAKLHAAGMDYVTAHNKDIPRCILQSPRNVVIHFLNGLFLGDGSIFIYDDAAKTKRLGVTYYSVSEDLITALHVLLLKFKVVGALRTRGSNLSDKTQWELVIRGENAIRARDVISMNSAKWEHTKVISMFSDKEKKPSIRKNGARFIVATNRGNKNVHLGSFDTEAECHIAFNAYWEKTRDVIKIRSVEKLPDQQILWDFHLPQTHSFIANGFVQHNSMIIDIFETVIAGFAAVSATPGENVRNIARQKLAEKLNIELDDSISSLGKSDNQIIIAGTTDYAFKHFYRYHKRWTDIIKSRGDTHKLKELFGEDYTGGIDWRDYSIIRMPYQLLPEGFMDEAQVARSRATMTKNNFNMEFETIFVSDSDGFFRRTLIDQCTVDEHKVIKLGTGRVLEPEDVYFEPEIYGDPTKSYVYGIDPASKDDNFSIVILEDCGDYRKIVYVWVTNEKDHNEKMSLGLAKEHNFYSYVVRKIRDLMRHYPCTRMAIDMGGGGIAVVDSLRDPDKCLRGEYALYPIIVPGKPKQTDGESGLHIIEEINFQNYSVVSEANHGLKKDFEDNVLLFPFYSGIELSLAEVDDLEKKRADNTLQQCIFNFEELKMELVSIVLSETATGKESYGTASVKVGVGRKSQMKKDRYSALLMANWVARNLKSTSWAPLATEMGGFAQTFEPEKGTKLFSGPSYLTSQLEKCYGNDD